MKFSISRPNLLAITDHQTTRPHFGASQNWYSDEWARRAGCGPTSAANILAYLALSHPGLSHLYGHEKMERSHFTRHMEEVYQFVTPGNMGLHRVEKFSSGVLEFARSRNILLEPHVFKVPGNMAPSRPNLSGLIEFLKTGLTADCPVAFLNLSRGKEKNLPGWHWVTITEADSQEDRTIVTVSDGGRQICLDFKLWYQTTYMGGGLCYFTHP